MLSALNLRRVEHGPALHKKLPPQLPQQLQRARPERLHAKARIAQRRRRSVHSRARFRRNRNQSVVLKKTNPVRPQFIQAGLAQGNRRTDRVERVLAAQRAEQQRHIGHGARQGANCAEDRERPHARRQMPASRNPSRRRLQRADAREVRRHAHRSAAIAAQPSRRKPRSNRRRLAAARSARRALQVPGIARPPVQQIGRLVCHQELRAVGRAQNQRSRRPEPRHHHRIFAWALALVQQTANLALQASRRN